MPKKKESRKGLQGVLNLFLGFKWIWIVLILFCGINLLMHFLFWPDSINSLSLSASRPWGIITGAFVHKDTDHLFNNLRHFVTFTLSFVVINMFGGIERKKFQGKVFFSTVFIAGTIISGPLELIHRNFSANVFGASGIVYAASAVLLISSLGNILYYIGRLGKDNWRIPLRKNLQYVLPLALSIFVILAVILWVVSPTFLGKGPQIGKIAHGTGFLGGLIIFVALFNAKNLKIEKKKFLSWSKKLYLQLQEFPKILFHSISNLKLKILEKTERSRGKEHTFLVTLFAVLLGIILTYLVPLIYPLITGNLTLESWKLFSLLFIFIVVFIALLHGHGCFDERFHEKLLSHRNKNPRIGILSDMGEGLTKKNSSWTHTPPSEWQEVISEAVKKEEPGIEVKKISMEQVLHSYTALNPYGGAYPELDLRSNQSLERVLEYVEDGGIFVNVSDIPFFWAYSGKLDRRVSLLKKKYVPQSGGVTSFSPYSSNPILSRLDISVQNVKGNVKINGERFDVERVLMENQNIQGIKSLAVAGKKAYPIARMKYGEGDSLFSLIFLDQGKHRGDVKILKNFLTKEMLRLISL